MIAVPHATEAESVPIHPDPATRSNCRAPAYAIVLLPVGCGRCGCAAHAALFWVPAGHQLREVARAGARRWVDCHECRLFGEVAWLDAGVRRQVAYLLPTLRATSATAGRAASWVNHCEHCGAPVTAPDGDGGVGLAWLLSRDHALDRRVLPVAERFSAQVVTWLVGSLAARVLDTSGACRSAVAAPG